MPMRRKDRIPPVAPRVSDFESFVAAMSASVTQLQRLLREAFESTLPPETGARACGRALGLGRTLGWQVWSLAYAPDTASALAKLPGPAGWKLLLAAFENAGLAAPRIRQVADAANDVRQILVSTKTSASLLRSMAAGGLASTNEATAFGQARRNARSAAETLHGVRCGLNAVASIVGPPDARNRCDLASASLFAGIERLRPGLPWPIYRWSVQTDAKRRSTAGGKAVSRSVLAPLVPELSTPGVEEGPLRRADQEDRASIEFVDAEGLPGRTLDATFIEAARKRGLLSAADEVQSMAMVVTLPLERAILDVLLHRDAPQIEVPTGALYSAFDPMVWVRKGGSDLLLQESCRLPLEREAKVVDSTRLPGKWNLHSDIYDKAVRRAMASIGHRLDEFHMIRLELPDPPLHGMVVIRWRSR